MRTSQPQYITLKFNVQKLDSMIKLILTKPEQKGWVEAIRDLVDIFDPVSYKQDREKEIRIILIKKLIKTISIHGAKDIDSLVALANIDGIHYDDLYRVITLLLTELAQRPMSEYEINTIMALVNDNLKYRLVEHFKDQIIKANEDIETGLFEDFDTKFKEMGVISQSMAKEYRRLETNKSNVKFEINLNEIDDLTNNCKISIDNAKNPNYKIKTGSQQLNECLNGGFEPGRVYGFNGTAKSGKSILLLNLAIWAKTLNTYTCKDPTKTPCVVYLSMENTSRETFDRLLAYIYGNKFNAAIHTQEQLVAGFKQLKISTPDIPGSTEFIVLFKEHRSISTAGISDIIDDLSDRGKEVQFLVFDYIMRIRSEERIADGAYNKELGAVINELQMIAKRYDIPIATASQLNRQAYMLIDSAQTLDDKINASFQLSSAHMGDSIDITRNLDVVVMISTVKGLMTVTDPETNALRSIAGSFMSFNITESRINGGDTTQFVLPYLEGNGLRLQMDYNPEAKTPLPLITTTAREFQENRGIQQAFTNQRPAVQQVSNVVTQQAANIVRSGS